MTGAPGSTLRPGRPWIRSTALWLGVYLALLSVWMLDARHPRVAGLFHDDGVYMALGRSLLERGVYRDPHSPEPIQIAKYPPGVPLMTALAQAVTRTPEAAVSVLRFGNALFLVLALAAFLALLRREGGTPARLRPLLGVAVAFSPPLLDYLRIPMSEVPYLGVLLGTLWLCARIHDDAERPWRHGALLAACCAAAFCFRTLGAVLAVTVGLHLLLARRRRTVLPFVLLGLPPMLALQAWLTHNAAPAVGFEDITVYGLPYPRILSLGLPCLPEVLLTNALQAPYSIVRRVLSGPFALLPLDTDIGWHVVWALVVATTVLLCAGIRHELRSPPPHGGPRLRPWHSFVLLSIAVVIPWPFEIGRFVVPLIPFLVLLLVRGAEHLGGRRAALAVAIALAASALGHALLDRAVQRPGRFTLEGRSRDIAPTLALAGVLRARLAAPREPVVASTFDSLLAVHGGVRGVWGWTVAQGCLDLYAGTGGLLRFRRDPSRAAWIDRELDAARLFYIERSLGADAAELRREEARSARVFGTVSVALQGDDRPPLLTGMEEARFEVREQFRRLGVTHAVLLLATGQPLYEVLLARLVRSLALEGRATPSFATPDALIQVWRVQP